MALYKRRFEDDMSVNYHDMWTYIANKISNNGENIFNANSAGSKHAQVMNEAAEIKTMSKELQEVIDDSETPEDERAQAENTLKMLQLKPLQNELRQQMLSRYQNNKVALYSFK